jgi:hypothetical protein
MQIFEQHGNGKRTVGILSVDTQALVDKLMEIEVGGAISYKELSELVGRDVQDKHRYLLASARRRLERSERIVFDVLKGEGLVRIGDDDIAMGSTRTVGRIHRAALRGRRRLAAGDYNAMSRRAQTVHNTNLSVLGVMEHFTRPSQVKKLEGKIESGGKSLPLQKTLAIFQD